MSNREKCIAIIDSLSEPELGNVAAMLQAARDAIREAADDAFCEALYQRYQQDPDKGREISIEEAARQLGVVL